MIFISHATTDDWFADLLAQELHIRGIRAWVDHVDMPAGTRWVKQLETALRQSDVLILILSEDSVQSSYVESEWHTFFDMKRPIIPVRINHCQVPLFLRTFHHVDFSDLSKFAEQFNVLLKVLPEFIESTKQSDAVDEDKKPVENTEKSPVDDIENLLKKTQSILNDSLLTLQTDTIQFVLPLEDVILPYRLSKPLILGRHHRMADTPPNIDLQPYTKSFMVSRQHAVVFREGVQVYIKDLSSTNGTFVGQNQLIANEPYPLQNYTVFFLSREFPIVCLFL